MKWLILLISLTVASVAVANLYGITPADNAQCEMVNADALKEIKEIYDDSASIVADNSKTMTTPCKVGCRLNTPKHRGPMPKVTKPISLKVNSPDLTPCGPPFDRNSRRCLNYEPGNEKAQSYCVAWPAKITTKKSDNATTTGPGGSTTLGPNVPTTKPGGSTTLGPNATTTNPGQTTTTRTP